ncbi:MAG: hypothetical protein LBJ10_09410 [Clostridiales bacterium]|nr:hypothetical protein [Clostridiales bacterium]
MNGTKNRRGWRIPAAIAAGALLLAAIIALAVADAPPSLEYSVAPDAGAEQSLLVTLDIVAPMLCKADAVSFYLGDKQLDILSYADSRGRAAELYFSDGLATAAIARGGRTRLVYRAAAAAQGKHGGRGHVGGDYAVFDGDQAFLLPAEYNLGLDLGGVVSGVKLSFDFPSEWKQIVPCREIRNPSWSDIYDLTQNAFAFGDFAEISISDGFRAYVPAAGAAPVASAQASPETAGAGAAEGAAASSADAATPGASAKAAQDSADATESGSSAKAAQAAQGTAGAGAVIGAEAFEGVGSLFSYYCELFGSAPGDYNVVLLPAAGGPVIGGAGTGVAAATFDPDSARDWQLLAHRMFHAFFDSEVRDAAVHAAPNTWFNEGLATYYENMSMDALPAPLRERLDVDAGRGMALLFDRYLYMRVKDPRYYNFAPMDEEELDSMAMTEFLHYTAAPLLVKYLVDVSAGQGSQPDALLKYCADGSRSFAERFVAFDAALDLLGESAGQAFCEEYFLKHGIPQLWPLKAHQPPDEYILDEINYIEGVLGSWFASELDGYVADSVSAADLRRALENAGKNPVAFLDPAMAAKIKDYAPQVYALLNDYYYRAKQLGVEFDDVGLRGKVLAPK